MNYGHDIEKGIIYSETILPSKNKLLIKASNIRKERTGCHATIGIYVSKEEDIVLAWSYLNIERDEDRTRLTNSAHHHIAINTDDTGYDKGTLKHFVDRFCLGLWDEFLKESLPQMFNGAEQLEEPLFFLKPYIIQGGGTILFGPPGRGKSFMGYLMITSIDAGIERFWPVMHLSTLTINLERSPYSIKQRMARINLILGLPQTRPLRIIHGRGKSLEDVVDSARKAIKEHGIDFVFLDSISRAGFGDLTLNRPVNAIMDCLNNLCPTWLALGHTPRANEEHIFGGVHFDAGADILVQLMSEQKKNSGDLGVGLQIVKANDTSLTPLEIWALEFNELGLNNIRRAKKSEFIELSGKHKLSPEEMIMEYILDLDAKKASATQIANALKKDRANISHLLKNSEGFQEVGRDGKEKLYGVTQPNF